MKTETRICRICQEERPIEGFRLTLGKGKSADKTYRLKTCKECQKAGMKLYRVKEKKKLRKRDTPPVTIQILRARLFIRLWHSGFDTETAIARVDQIYPTWRKEWDEHTQP